jgi:hypothetical protein
LPTKQTDLDYIIRIEEFRLGKWFGPNLTGCEQKSRALYYGNCQKDESNTWFLNHLKRKQNKAANPASCSQ